MNKHFKLFLKIAVSIGLLYILYRTNVVDLKSFVTHLNLLDLRYLPLIFGLLVLNYIVSSIRWKALLVHGDSKNVSVLYLTKLYFIGSFFNNFLPTSIGGDVYKIYRLSKKIKNATNAFSATFMERFTGVLVLGLISVGAIVSLFGYVGAAVFVGFVVSIIVGFALLRVLSDRFKLLNKIYTALLEYRNQHRVLMLALVTSLLVQLLSIFTQYFIFLSLGQTLPISYSLFVFPVIGLISFLPISLNGIGVQDSLYVTFFSQIGIAAELALAASVLYHLARLAISLVGGLLYATTKD